MRRFVIGMVAGAGFCLVTPWAWAGAFGPQTVWTAPDDAEARCGEASNPGQCVEAIMRSTGASAEALAFAKRCDFTCSLTQIGHEGRVVSGTSSELLSPGRNSDLPVLLNGQPDIIDVWEKAPQKQIAQILRSFKGAIADFSPPSLQQAQSTSSGGQRFTYEIEVKQCRACDVKTHILLDYDFDATGKFLGSSSRLAR